MMPSTKFSFKIIYLITIVLLTLLSGVTSATSNAQSAKKTEYYLKAGFIINFARLVQWPENTFQNDNSNIVIGIIDPAPFENALNLISKKEVRGKKISVKICNGATNYDDINILFLNTDNNKLRKQIIALIKNKPILTIGESPSFAKNEGIINFYKKNNKLRFEINRIRAQYSNLKISSRLLKLGKIIRPANIIKRN